jgi:TIGR03009 family protein
MTRHLIAVPLVVALAVPLAAQTYTNPNAQSRYAPPANRAAAAGPAVAGPAVAGPPVRQVVDEQPIRQPMSPARNTQPQTAIAPVGPILAPQQPSWIPLDPKHEEWVNTVLQYWENRSNKIKALTCQFVRWEYDPVFGPKLASSDPKAAAIPDPETAFTIARGEIKYQQPDKGKFQITSLSRYAGPPEEPGDKPKYVAQDASFGEHWVSDGKNVFEFDSRNKRVIQRELPPEMQGKAIADGPLPFLFGARAETIRARYWVRGLPQSGNGKYWLEAVPKSRQDAQNFKAVTIVLDEKNYLPELLEVLAPNFDSKTNPARTTYQLNKYDVTDDKFDLKEQINRLNVFKSAFYAPTAPPGWTKVVQRADGSTVGPGGANALEATKPAPPRTRSPLPR